MLAAKTKHLAFVHQLFSGSCLPCSRRLPSSAPVPISCLCTTNLPTSCFSSCPLGVASKRGVFLETLSPHLDKLMRDLGLPLGCQGETEAPQAPRPTPPPNLGDPEPGSFPAVSGSLGAALLPQRPQVMSEGLSYLLSVSVSLAPTSAMV